MGFGILGIASVAASLAGAGISAYGQYQAGKAQKQMAEYNARVNENSAKAEFDASRENSKRQREMNQRHLSSLRARMARGGTEISSGSSLDVLGTAASELELQTLDLFRESEAKQVAYRNQATLARYEGKQAASAAKIGAIGTLIGGVGSAASSFFSGKQTGVIRTGY